NSLSTAAANGAAWGSYRKSRKAFRRRVSALSSASFRNGRELVRPPVRPLFRNSRALVRVGRFPASDASFQSYNLRGRAREGFRRVRVRFLRRNSAHLGIVEPVSRRTKEPYLPKREPSILRKE